MRKTTLIAACLLGLSCFTNGLFAQDGNTATHQLSVEVPEVAIIDVEPEGTTTVNLSFTQPAEAGNPITVSATDVKDALWLNYSSIVTDAAGADPTRNISVKISPVLPGIDLSVQAATYSGSGAGTFGTPGASALVLTAADQNIITGIGSAYTGNGANNGHNLTYSATVGAAANSYQNLVSNAGSNTTTVTYTISDN